MNTLISNERIVKQRSRLTTIYTRSNVPLEKLLASLQAPGERLKVSKKALTRRVGTWVIKESCGPFATNVIKHTLRRNRCRRAWRAAHYLLSKGVCVPQPIAYLEKSLFGCIAGYVMISEYLEGQRSVAHYMQALVEQEADKKTISHFLENLGEAVNQLCTSGAYHGDLKGSNIFTKNGESFYFIDLDAAVIGKPYTQEIRLGNHVQLYDSFCNLLDDAMLVPFIQRMLPAEFDARVWLPALRKAQVERRRFVRKPWRSHQEMPKL